MSTTTLPFHPLADIFPLMEGEEFDALVADIKARGQHAQIVLKDGMILDGRNRYRACLAAGIEPMFACEAYSNQVTDPVAYVISANIKRRHLTTEQKRELIAKLIKASPEKSNRQIASTAQVDHKTVAAVRVEKQTTGEIPQLKKTIGKDGKTRRRPAKKAKPKISKASSELANLVIDTVLPKVEAGKTAARPETCHPDHQGPVTSTQPETVGSSPQGDAELMTKKQVFDLEPAPGLEQVGDKGPKQVEDRNHRVG